MRGFNRRLMAGPFQMGLTANTPTGGRTSGS